MNAKLTILVALLTTACSSAGNTTGDEEILDEYEAAVLLVHELADGYVAEIDGAADVAAVEPLQSGYQADMEGTMSDLEHALEDIGGCEMMGGGMDRVDEAMGSLDAIRGSVEAMIAGHADHEDVEDCHAAAEVHEGEVDLEVEAMEGHPNAWRDMGMDCGQGHDDG